jgi:hypothetical protein
MYGYSVKKDRFFQLSIITDFGVLRKTWVGLSRIPFGGQARTEGIGRPNTGLRQRQNLQFISPFAVQVVLC